VARIATQRELDKGLEAHRGGRLAEAEKLYRKVLRAAPQHHEALHLLGLLRHQQGDPGEAERLIRMAIRNQPDATVYYENLVAIQRGRGGQADAVETCRNGLLQGPSVRLASELMEALLALGRVAEAEAAATQVLTLDRDNGNALAVLAELATSRGEHRHAAQLWQQASQAHPQWQAAAINLGMSLLRAGDADAALRTLTGLGLPADPGVAGALLNARAAAHRKLSQPAPAEALLRQALALAPGSAEFLSNLSDLRRRGDPTHALLLARLATAAEPGNGGAYNNQGLALTELDRLDEARAMYSRAVALEPANAETLNNLCDPLRWLGELDVAGRVYARALAIHPDLPAARYSHGTYQLLRGQLEPGWANYAWRIADATITVRRPFDLPFWDGKPLDGRLLVWGEQGFGDEVIFGSMLPDLARSGIPAIVECDPRLVSIWSRSFPGLDFAARATPPDPRLSAADVVAQVPLGDLARSFRTRIGDFPTAGGCLIPRQDLLEHWRRRLEALGPGPKIGFAWRSRTVNAVSRRFHPPLEQWRPMLGVASATFVCLQYGDVAAELAHMREATGATVHSFAELDLFNDIEGALALSAALDLAISTGTTAFTLPAAAGVPVWIATPASDWFRFGTDRYPWFPSVTLYAHPYRAPWSATISRIADDLTARLAAAAATERGSS
jgi:Flp pilus assembly protein TadD